MLPNFSLTQIKLFKSNCFLFFVFWTQPDMDEMSSNSCSGSTVSTIQYRSMPHIHFPPPPMQPSSAYECYTNVIIPKRRVPFADGNGMAAQSAAIPVHPMLTTDAYQPIEYPQPEYYYDQYSDHAYSPYEQHINVSDQRRQSVSVNACDCIDMQNTPIYNYGCENFENIYDQRKHLERFGLSKKGLLQIDYSLSWMNLQRLISSK